MSRRTRIDPPRSDLAKPTLPRALLASLPKRQWGWRGRDNHDMALVLYGPRKDSERARRETRANSG